MVPDGLLELAIHLSSLSPLRDPFGESPGTAGVTMPVGACLPAERPIALSVPGEGRGARWLRRAVLERRCRCRGAGRVPLCPQKTQALRRSCPALHYLRVASARAQQTDIDAQRFPGLF